MKIDVKHIAKLANLPLSDEEVKKFEKQLEETLTYVSQLNKVNTDNIEATSQVTGLENVIEDDSPRPSLSQEDALKNAPKTHNGFFVVKGIFKDE